ncbi:hypothetical protein N7519_004510 [Penicillium mononematosum]|uniref:uncharacterized protein n=1 Tax=Penicillium mononematosum TaxID=268346 RepID=UPI002547CABD|nr:uncharacterized protein N7519_004510 [Penicillium mononematosum]KAJ6189602.1 hypothetical protein N7519_004510 [Penicillium mononematosum]
MVKKDLYQPLSGENDHPVPVLRAFNTHLLADGRANVIRHFRSEDRQAWQSRNFISHTRFGVDSSSPSAGRMDWTTICTLRTKEMESLMEDIGSWIDHWSACTNVDAPTDETVAPQPAGALVRGSRLESECLKRDGNKCVVTRRFVYHLMIDERKRQKCFETLYGVCPYHSFFVWNMER